MSDTPSAGRSWPYLLFAVLGPLGLTLLYLIGMEVRGEESFAPGQGAGAAHRTMQIYWFYCIGLIALVVGGTLKAPQATTKLAYIAVSTPVSLVVALIAFFSQMAR